MFRRCRFEYWTSVEGDDCADEKCRTGASKVLPVVHIARRLPWEQVKEAEKELDDYSPVTAPAPNRSGEQILVSWWESIGS